MKKLSMKKISIPKVKQHNSESVREVQKPSIEHFYNFKQRAMVRIRGNFIRSGFNISQNKVRAILLLQEELQDFVSGKYNDNILSLEEGETLSPNDLSLNK